MPPLCSMPMSTVLYLMLLMQAMEASTCTQQHLVDYCRADRLESSQHAGKARRMMRPCASKRGACLLQLISGTPKNTHARQRIVVLHLKCSGT